MRILSKISNYIRWFGIKESTKDLCYHLENNCLDWKYAHYPVTSTLLVKTKDVTIDYSAGRFFIKINHTRLSVRNSSRIYDSIMTNLAKRVYIEHKPASG